MKRRLHTKKILAATIGIGAVSYVIACGGTTDDSTTAGNGQDAGEAGRADVIVSSGNLMAPPTDARVDDAADDVGVTSGNLMAPFDAGADAADANDGSHDASDDGG